VTENVLPQTEGSLTSFLEPPVAIYPDSAVGSPDLADALSEGDPSAIAQALGGNALVVVPLVANDGSAQGRYRLLPALPGSAAVSVLPVFSSVAAYDRFLGPGNPDRLFRLTHPFALVRFLNQHFDDLAAVVFDEGSPGRREFPVTVVLDWLVAGAEATLAEAEAATPPAGTRAVDYELPLNRHQWAMIPLTDPIGQDEQIRRLVREQTRSLGDRGAALRHDLREWFAQTARQAAGAGGHRMAYLVTRTPHAALGLSAVTYWHDLGPETTPGHLDRIAELLRPPDGSDDGLTHLAQDDTDLLRHTRVRKGSPQLTGDTQLPLLLIDYYLTSPDRLAVAHVAFSTPHTEFREPILILTDNIVLGGDWHWLAPTRAEVPVQTDT
jgi:hypothetical protein